MKFSSLVITGCSIAVLSACSQGGGGKKVTIMASGKITVSDQDPKKVTLEPGTTHNEKEISLDEAGKQTVSVTTPDGVKTFDAEADGRYLLNLKTDTLTGGIVKYGATNSRVTLTGEDVDRMIDSTRQLLVGANASDDKKTYFLPPFTIKKISNDADAKLVGPYNGIPGTLDASSGKVQEVYKFFTNKDKRSSLENLLKERKK